MTEENKPSESLKITRNTGKVQRVVVQEVRIYDIGKPPRIEIDDSLAYRVTAKGEVTGTDDIYLLADGRKVTKRYKPKGVGIFDRVKAVLHAARYGTSKKNGLDNETTQRVNAEVDAHNQEINNYYDLVWSTASKVLEKDVLEQRQIDPKTLEIIVKDPTE